MKQRETLTEETEGPWRNSVIERKEKRARESREAKRERTVEKQ